MIEFYNSKKAKENKRQLQQTICHKAWGDKLGSLLKKNPTQTTKDCITCPKVISILHLSPYK